MNKQKIYENPYLLEINRRTFSGWHWIYNGKFYYSLITNENHKKNETIKLISFDKKPRNSSFTLSFYIMKKENNDFHYQIRIKTKFNFSNTFFNR